MIEILSDFLKNSKMGGGPQRDIQASGGILKQLGEVACFTQGRKNFVEMAKKLKAKEEAARLKELEHLPARECTEEELDEYLQFRGYSIQRINDILNERWLRGSNGLVFSRLPDVLLKDLQFCFNKETHREQLIAFHRAGGSCPKCEQYLKDWTDGYLGKDMMPEPFDIVDRGSLSNSTDFMFM